MAGSNHAIDVALIAAAAGLATLLLQGTGSLIWRRLTKASRREHVEEWSMIANTLAAMRERGISQEEIEQARLSIAAKARHLPGLERPEAGHSAGTVHSDNVMPLRLPDVLGAEGLEQSEVRLQSRVRVLEDLMNQSELALFRKAFDSWKYYRELQTKASSIGYTSVAGSSMAESIEKDILTREKVAEIESEINKRQRVGPSSSPRINWSSFVGCQGWRSSYTFCGETILVTTAGRQWNVSDEDDGVICLNRISGIELWRFPTRADVNEGTLIGGIFCFGCDDGCIYGIRAVDGQEVWRRKFNAAAVARPELLPLSLGGRDISAGPGNGFAPVVCATYDGRVIVLDSRTGSTVSESQVGSCINSNLAVLPQFPFPTIYVPCTNGVLYSFYYDEENGSLRPGPEMLVQYPSEYSTSGYANAYLAVPPLAYEGGLILPVCRDTTYNYPPIAFVDRGLGSIRWPEKSNSGDFGNIRTRPVLADKEIIIAGSYADSIYAASIQTGEVIWSIKLGETVFQQWSSPVVVNDSLYVGRIDGFLYRACRAHKRLDWGLFLGDNSTAGAISYEAQSGLRGELSGIWSSPIGAAILSTPVVLGDVVYAATADGYLYCVDVRPSPGESS